MRAVVIIPARFASSRFPGKPLVHLLAKPMILWVAELSAESVGFENVYVATEDKRIAEVVLAAGFQVIMTSERALTGTDRLAEAAANIEADIFINVQGDEPLVNPSDIARICDVKAANMDAVVNCYSWLSDEENPKNVNLPKVITNEANELIYMSRTALPGHKDPDNAPARYKKQVCIYAFTADELEAFRNFGRKSELEQFEDIEILRFLEFGKRVLMIEAQEGSLAVDVPEDVAGVEAALKRKIGL
ncbi:3-deoxy-manno-octulosonate cytidylyltransferase [Luminiphilus sp.]|nr:3-deoxy-manno-octulosonate cytidylyltransferase [Luminiphilus sp.]